MKIKKRNVIGDFIIEDTEDSIKVRDIFTNHVLRKEKKKNG